MLTDQIVGDPRPLDRARRAELDDEFAPEELAELALTVALASAFSRLSIAWGPPPAIPVIEVSTPTPDGTVG